MPTTTYRGCTFRRTSTTVEVFRTVFGRGTRALANVWEIKGRYGKPAMVRPFLTSRAACKTWVRGQHERRMAAIREQMTVKPIL